MYSAFTLPGLFAIVCTLVLATNANAELHSRLNGDAAYDDILDITWLTNAGLSGSDSWSNQLAWIDHLNESNHMGFNDWRLASMSVSSGIPIGTSETIYDCATVWEPLCYDNELGYMFYYHLNGKPGVSRVGDHTINGITFSNAQATYHSGTEFGTTTSWMMHFDSGFSVWTFQNGNRHGWAVRDGDVLDTDNDGVVDSLDNCLLVDNASQIDSDLDGFGNACDLDLDNNDIVNFLDISLFSALFGSASGGIADTNGDGFVNFLDFNLFATSMFQPPGPSGID